MQTSTVKCNHMK